MAKLIDKNLKIIYRKAKIFNDCFMQIMTNNTYR